MAIRLVGQRGGPPVPAIENWRAVRWLAARSGRPAVAAKLWCVLWVVRDPDTGEIGATRADLAEIVGTTPDQISRVMTLLEQVGAVIRRREKVPGRRGPGVAVYVLKEGIRYPDPD